MTAVYRRVRMSSKSSASVVATLFAGVIINLP